MMKLVKDIMLMEGNGMLCEVWKVLKQHHPEYSNERVLGARLFMIARVEKLGVQKSKSAAKDLNF